MYEFFRLTQHIFVTCYSDIEHNYWVYYLKSFLFKCKYIFQNLDALEIMMWDPDVSVFLSICAHIYIQYVSNNIAAKARKDGSQCPLIV